MQNDFQHFVGIDWGSEKHRVCLMDRAGRVVEQRWVEPNGHSLTELVDWLRRQTFESPSVLAAAIEIPRGAMMKNPEIHDPRKTITAENQCMRLTIGFRHTGTDQETQTQERS